LDPAIQLILVHNLWSYCSISADRTKTLVLTATSWCNKSP